MIKISNVWIDSTTETFATVQMPAEIGPSQLVTFKRKVDNSVGGDIIPLCTFTKLFPRCINADGSPRGLNSSMTCLTAYNRSKIPHFGILDTPIYWTSKGKDVANCLQTQYMVDMLGPAILGLPSCAKLGTVELDCAVNHQKKKWVSQKKSTTEGRKVKQNLQHLNTPPLNTKEDFIQTYPDMHTCSTEVPHCIVATGARKIRWVPGKRNHYPSGGAKGLGILTHLLLEG